jgi:hypothetical protein
MKIADEIHPEDHSRAEHKSEDPSERQQELDKPFNVSGVEIEDPESDSETQLNDSQALPVRKPIFRIKRKKRSCSNIWNIYKKIVYLIFSCFFGNPLL